MKYYKKLFIPEEATIRNKSLQFIKARPRIYHHQDPGSWYNFDFKQFIEACPEVLHAFDSYGLRCKFAAVIVMLKQEHLHLHVDYGSLHTLARINIPLCGCEGSRTNFYVGGNPVLYVNPVTGIKSYKMENSHECRLIDYVEMDQTAVIRTSVVHDVTLPGNFVPPRIMLTLSFDKDPVFLLDQH